MVSDHFFSLALGMLSREALSTKKMVSDHFLVHPESSLGASRLWLCRSRYPANMCRVSWIARILSLKNSWTLKPYACRFMVLILLLVPSSGPVVIIAS